MKWIFAFVTWSLIAAATCLVSPLAAQTSGYQWTNFVGLPGGVGNADATGSIARFNNPGGVAVDSSGNVYVADRSNAAIRKITPAGAVTTFVGTTQQSGTSTGTGAAARFFNPEDAVWDPLTGNLYVLDRSNTQIRKVTPGGVVTVLAGVIQSSTGADDGAGNVARFKDPWAIAIDSAGDLYVADSGNHLIRKVIASTGVVSTIAGTKVANAGVSGSADHATDPLQASFNTPRGIVVDNSTGNIYVGDTNNHTVRRITPAGAVTTLAGLAGTSGSTDNATGSLARFNNPYGIKMLSGNLIVADHTNATIRQVTTAGAVTTLAGTAGQRSGLDGTGTAARFFDPQGLAIDSSGNVFIADTTSATIRKMTTPGNVVTTLAGSARNFGATNGTGTAARFNAPTGAVADSSGNLYIADTGSLVVRKVTPAGVVTTFAGSGASSFVNGTGTAATFRSVNGMAIDSSGNIYVADGGNHAIRMITTPGAVVTTLAGAGSSGSADGTGTGASFNSPVGVALDGLGNLWVADTNNHVLRKIVLSSGVVTTIAGLAGTSGSTNATGTAARFNQPAGISFDGSGNLFIADRGNQSIRMISPTLAVTTFAGLSGTFGNTDGTGSSARFWTPYMVAFDNSGYLYVGDSNNHLIRKISPSAQVRTIGGSATFGTSADGTGSNAWFSGPRGMVIGSTGEVYLVDSNNNRISKGIPQLPLLTTGTASGVSSTSATLNGTVNPNGTITTAVFQYGTTTSYGNTLIITLSPNDDLAAQNVSASVVSGLTPNTTYHFRLSAINGATGTATSTDGTFTTQPPAPDILVEKPAGTVLLDSTGSASLGSVVTGASSTAQTFTIRNSGGQDLTSLAVSVDGTNASEFTVNTSGMATTLSTGQTTTFTVTFAPLVSGARTAALHVASNVSGSKNPYDVNLTGTATLPAGWTNADIGGPVPSGGTTYDSTAQQFTVSGGGSLSVSSPGTPDKFQYAWQNVTGNFVATAKLESISFDPNSGAAPRAGLMLRATTDSLSPYAMIGARRDGTTGSTQTSFESWRVHSSDQPIQTNNYANAAAPFWIRITRWNDKIRLQISWNGTDWASENGMIIDNLPQTVCIGFATASRDSALSTTAVFSNFSVQPLTLTHESSWIGNSVGGPYYGPHVMDAVHDLAVDSANGVLVMAGDEETREMHILDLNGNYRYVARNTSPNGGQQRNVVLDGTNLFTVGPNGVERWRYDGFRTHVNSLTSPTPALTGITLVGSSLYAVDSTSQQVRVFAKADLTENTSMAFAVANAQRITADASGYLWIAQANSGSAHKVLRYSTAGVAQPQQITLFADSIVSGVTVHPVTGEIWVADRGPRQQFHIFNPDGTFNRSFGAQGGIYSTAFGTILGQPHPMKFNSPTDVEFDANGNTYVACMGSSNQWTQGSGTEVRKFDASSNQLWELLGLTYVDNADAVPGTDGTEVHTQTRRITIDYSKPTGQQWTYAGCTFDPFTYPQDARATQSQPGPAAVRMIGGSKILFITQMDANWVAMYRFQSGSEIAIPCGLIKRETARGQPGNTFYIWVDANGDGAVDANEVDTSLASRSEIWGFTIDDNGGLWAADKGSDKIRYYPCKGLNSIGAPKYGALYSGTSEQEWPAPSDFIGGSTVYPLRAVYSAANDELYVGGYRVGREEQRWQWKAVGSCLGRYAGWLNGVRTKQWLIDVPYDPSVLYNPDASNGSGTTACMAVAGDYVFTAFMPTLGVSIYNRFTGAFVQTLEAGPEVCGNGALIDIVNGLSAIRRSNGEYVMWLEDDGAQKTNMYRWTAPATGEISIEQPAGTPLTDGVSSIAFGTLAPNTSASRTFTIRNDGSTTLYDLNVNIDGTNATDFNTNALNTTTLSPGASTTFTVTFTAADGARAASLHVLSNDADEASFDIALTGTGISANANLSDLTLSTGTLTPSFSSLITSYTAAVSYATTSLSLTTGVAQANASVTVNGGPNAPINLNYGDNVITVVVTAQDGTTTKTYTLTINRASPLPGSLDLGFNSTGKVTTPFGNAHESAFGVAVQTDGKIVAVGYMFNGSNDDFAVARYLPNGTLDTGFGTGGKVTVPFGSEDDDAYGVALQADGKIVVVGRSSTGGNHHFAVARLTPEGIRDSSFGTDGKVVTPLFNNDYAYSVVLQRDEKIVVAGRTVVAGIEEIALVRYTVNGVPDNSFGSSGVVHTPIGTGGGNAHQVVLQNDDKIVVAGYAGNGSNQDFAVVRYDTNGIPDPSFNGTGKVLTPVGSGDDFGLGVTMQRDQKIVVTGSTFNGSTYDAALVRYDINGTPDQTFGNAGKRIISMDSGNDESYGVVVQDDGKIVIAGYAGTYPNSDFMVARLTTTGALDSTFNTTGKVITPIGGSNDVAYAIALQKDGGIVLAGFANNGTNIDFALARYVNDAVQTRAASIITASTATLNGNVNAYNESTAISFDYGTTTAYGTHVTGTPTTLTSSIWTTVSASITGLSQGTTYHFRVNRTSSTGSINGGDVTFTTSAPEIAMFDGATTAGTALTDGQGTAVNLGSTPQGTALVHSFTVKNSGLGDLHVSGITLPFGCELVNTFAATTVPPNTTFTFQIRLPAPLAPGTFAGTMQVFSDDADEATFDVPISGVVVGPDIAITESTTSLTVGASTVAYGETLRETPLTKTFVVSNTGNATLNLTGITLPTGYSLVTAFSPATIPVGNTTLSYQVRLNATAAGTFNGTLSLASNDLDEASFDVALTGIVRAPDIRVFDGATTAGPELTDGQAGVINFGSTPRGTPLTHSFTIQNDGDGDLHVTGINLPTGFQFVGAFTALTLAPNATSLIQVQAAATTGGTFSGSLSLTNDDTDEAPFDFPISVVVLEPEIRVFNGANVGSPELQSNVATVDFGNALVGSSSPRTLTIQNVGNANLTGLTITQTGAHPLDFSVNTSPAAPLAPNATTTFTIAFQPTDMGTRTASIRIASNDADENPFIINMTGVGQKPEITVLDPDGADLSNGGAGYAFDLIATSPSGAKTFTIKNDGNISLTGLDVAKDGADASQFVVSTTGMSATLAPGASTTFTVNFTPSGYGLRNAALHITSNDADENAFDVPLTAESATIKADLVGNTLTITDLLGTSNTLSLTQSGSDLILNEPNAWFSSGSGGTLSGDGHTLTMPISTGLSLRINGGAGNDVINIGAFTTALGTVLINGDAGNDTVNFQGDINFTLGSVMNVDLTNDMNAGDFDTINVLTNANLILSRTGSATLACSGPIKFYPGSSLITMNGNIFVSGNQTGTPSSGSFAGVEVDTAQIRSNGSGNVTVSGQGGTSGNNQDGISVKSGGEISSNTGSTTVTGIGGSGSGSSNDGVSVDGSGSKIGSDSGPTNINGTGGSGSGAENTGVSASNGGSVGSSSGSSTITGTGGAGSGGGNTGVAATGGGRIGSGTGNTFVHGTGGSLGSSGNDGIRSDGTGSTIGNAAGNTTLDGTAGAGGTSGGVATKDSGALLGNGAPPSINSLAAVFTPNGLSLRGSVIANGSNTSVIFDYDTDITDGDYSTKNALATPSTVTGGAPTTVSKLITGLVPGATYHHRVRASNANGATYGADIITPPTPQIVVEQPTNTVLTSVVTKDLGSVNIASTSSAMTFTIRNVGTASLNSLALAKDGTNPADFALSGPAVTSLASGATTTFTATFTPSASGARSASVHLISNDPDDSPFNLALTGTGQSTGTPITSWRQTYFGTPNNSGSAADLFDYDHDGLVNLLEYAFGLDPTKGTSNHLPGGQKIGNNFVISFTQPAEVTGITYGAEWSTSLTGGSWSTEGITHTNDAGIHTFTIPVLSNSQLFMRLTVTSP